MPATTSKGVPYSLGSDAASTIDTTMQSLAEWVNANPGIAVLTESQRNALSGVARWANRVIVNATNSRLERWNSTLEQWEPAVRDMVSTLGGSIIAPSAASVRGLTIRAAANQTASLLELQNSSGASVGGISSSGAIVGLTKTLRDVETIRYKGSLQTGEVGGFYVSLPAGQSSKLMGGRARVTGPQVATIEIQLNGVTVPGSSTLVNAPQYIGAPTIAVPSGTDGVLSDQVYVSVTITSLAFNPTGSNDPLLVVSLFRDVTF